MNAMVSPVNHRKTLCKVIDLAVEIINRVNTTSRLPAIVEVTVEVDAARAVLVEGGPIIRDEASMLLDALANIEAERMQGGASISRADRWCMVAGCLLPMVRENLSDALARSVRPSTTDHDFGRAGR